MVVSVAIVTARRKFGQTEGLLIDNAPSGLMRKWNTDDTDVTDCLALRS